MEQTTENKSVHYEEDVETRKKLQALKVVNGEIELCERNIQLLSVADPSHFRRILILMGNGSTEVEVPEGLIPEVAAIVIPFFTKRKNEMIEKARELMFSGDDEVVRVHQTKSTIDFNEWIAITKEEFNKEFSHIALSEDDAREGYDEGLSPAKYIEEMVSQWESNED